MTTKEACEIVDEVKAGEYHPRMIRTLASSVLSGEMLKARGEWRDGEISLNALLGVQSVCRNAMEVLA